MSNLEFKEIYLQIEHEINHLSQSTFVFYRNAIKEDTKMVISDLKTDIDAWISSLNQRKISCYELENLLESKRLQIKLLKLEAKDIDKEKLEFFKNEILRLIARAIFNTYLNSLFKNPSKVNEKELRKVNWF
jgi:hypothetical protein